MYNKPKLHLSLNDEANKQACATTAYSSFCVEVFAIMKVSRLPLRARNWLVEQKDSVLLISTSTTLKCLFRVCCIVAG